jgi:hypothetical protein
MVLFIGLKCFPNLNKGLYQICLALVVDLKRGSAAERQADVVACSADDVSVCFSLFSYRTLLN